MPRQPRLEIANGVYHVTNRGLERRDIVLDDRDRQTWLRLLGRVATRAKWRVFAHALMSNHFHIYLRTPQPNLGSGMHDFESGYATLFNKHHDRVGPLFQGRYHAVLVEHETHGWELSRYVHLNPVRAGACFHPADYYWSSYRHYMDSRFAPAWLDWRTILAEFHGTEAAARLAYRKFVQAGLADRPANPLAAVTDGWLLGGEEFVARFRVTDGHGSEKLGVRTPSPEVTLEEIIKVTSDITGVSVTRMCRRGEHGNVARQAALVVCRELCSVPLSVLASRFGGVGVSAISEAVRVARGRADEDATLRDLLAAIRAALAK